MDPVKDKRITYDELTVLGYERTGYMRLAKAVEWTVRTDWLEVLEMDDDTEGSEDAYDEMDRPAVPGTQPACVPTHYAHPANWVSTQGTSFSSDWINLNSSVLTPLNMQACVPGPGQVMDERQNEMNAQCNEQDVLSMPQDFDVHKEVEEDSVDATYVSKAGDDEAQDVKHDSIILPSPAKDLQARRYEGEEKQLSTGCYIAIKPSKWGMTRDSSTIVQRSAKYSLHQEGDGFIMSVGTSSKHCKMCCTSFNLERKVVIYEASHTKVVIYEASHTKEVIDEAFFSLQYHSYTSELCRVVDKEVGIARALLHSCSWNKSMQLQNVFSVVWSQVMFNKAT
ncbi:MAG: hypothetical protein GY737_26735 [Desulfobacteraceae bacterium]|nr:hypothetical protein [Desulfobacteraceae bacterium]